MIWQSTVRFSSHSANLAPPFLARVAGLESQRSRTMHAPAQTTGNVLIRKTSFICIKQLNRFMSFVQAYPKIKLMMVLIIDMMVINETTSGDLEILSRLVHLHDFLTNFAMESSQQSILHFSFGSDFGEATCNWCKSLESKFFFFQLFKLQNKEFKWHKVH